MQAQNRMGHTLGNYRLTKLLGRGGFAEVYLAENVYLEIQTAIKVLKLQDLDTLEQEKFRSEAKFMTTLKHPHIVAVLDYGIEMSQRGSGSDGSTPYLVMEYAPLGTLRHLYPHNTPMALPKIASYTKQIAEALQYAHDKNVTHLDIKPENMLVRKSDDIALSDFGIAVTGLNTSNLQQQQTEIMQKLARGEPIVIPGTAAYLAPERLRGHTQRACDQYSLAVVVYEWLCGKRPFEGSDLEICQKHVKELPPPLHKANPAISRDVEQVVQKALSKEPADRYGSVAEFAQTLEKAIQASSPPLNSTIFPSTVSPSPTRIATPVSSPATPIAVTPPQPSPVRTPTGSPVGSQQGQQQIHLPDPHTRQPGLHSPQASTLNNHPFNAGTQANPQHSGSSKIADEISGIIGEPITTIEKIFATDKHFVKTKRTRQFLLLGVPVNILSALIVLISGPLPTSVIIAIVGGAIAITMLWRCTVSVKKPIAITFGAGVALWWGYVVANVAAHIPGQSITVSSFLIAFAISIGLHIWYVDNRLKN